MGELVDVVELVVELLELLVEESLDLGVLTIRLILNLRSLSPYSVRSSWDIWWC